MVADVEPQENLCDEVEYEKYEDYQPEFYVSENGVGYIPSTELAKTPQFKKHLDMMERLLKEE